MVFSERRRKLDPANTEEQTPVESRPWGGTRVVHLFRTLGKVALSSVEAPSRRFSGPTLDPPAGYVTKRANRWRVGVPSLPSPAAAPSGELEQLIQPRPSDQSQRRKRKSH